MEIIGKNFVNSMYRNTNVAPNPRVMATSTQVALYAGVAHGRRGCESVGTTMVYRSSHMPIITEIDAITVPFTVRVFLRARMENGTMKQVTNITQNGTAQRPVTFAQNTTRWAGSLP